MSRLLHVYKTVAAQLFRAQERSTVAEEAWARATLDDDVLADAEDSTIVRRLDRTRMQAIDFIRAANMPSTLSERATAALDHAFYSAIAQIRQTDASSTA